MTYRLGEVYPYDLRIRAEFNVVNHVEFVKQQEHANDPTRRQAQYTNQPRVDNYPKDILLVPHGTAIAERALALLGREHRAFVDGLTPRRSGPEPGPCS